jgi:hypothetical protein
VVAISLSLAGVLEAWLSFAAWMKTVRVELAVRPFWSVAARRPAAHDSGRNLQARNRRPVHPWPSPPVPTQNSESQEILEFSGL